jgi:hypothetical protein
VVNLILVAASLWNLNNYVVRHGFSSIGFSHKDYRIETDDTAS